MYILGEYDLQLANWKMESLVKEPESSSDDEFYDAEGSPSYKCYFVNNQVCWLLLCCAEMPNISPITKWSSLEYIPSDFAPHREQSVEATDDCKILTICFSYK